MLRDQETFFSDPLFTKRLAIGHRDERNKTGAVLLLRNAIIMLTKQIVHAAEDRLVSSSHLFLRHVECHVEEDTLCLEGKVPSFYLKQTAQSLLQSIDGVERVVNRLEVVNPYGVSSEPAKPEATLQVEEPQLV